MKDIGLEDFDMKVLDEEDSSDYRGAKSSQLQKMDSTESHNYPLSDKD